LLVGELTLSNKFLKSERISRNVMSPKKVRLNWEEWQEYCAEHNIDPRKHCEDGIDLGGGNSIEIVCVDEPPEEE